MASMTGDVLPEPPGFQHLNNPRWQLITGSGPASSSSPSDLTTREIVREVTDAVREDLEMKTAEAVGSLRLKGERALHALQKEHQEQTSALQSQLLLCAEAQRQLQEEHVMLRTGVQDMMKQFQMIFGHSPFHSPHPMPTTPPFQSSPVLPRAPPVTIPPRGLLTPVPQESPFEKTPPVKMPTTPNPTQRASTLSQIPEELEQQRNAMAGASVGAGGLSTSLWQGTAAHDMNFSTSLWQDSASHDKNSSPRSTPVTPVGGRLTQEKVGTTLPVVNATLATSPLPIPTGPGIVCITIRRADHDVPLGLDVNVGPDNKYLQVEKVRVGGAVEALNRQCAGESREIIAGDRIIRVNDATDAREMSKECIDKLLLKIVLSRDVAKDVTCDTSQEDKSLEPHQSTKTLRADADEFVPCKR